MLEQQVKIDVNATQITVWDYVSDMANWASNMPGYRSFEILSESDSLWTLKIGFGSLVRTVKVRVHIELWQKPDQVSFTYHLDNDPVDGDGCYVAQCMEDGRTFIALTIRINGQGRMAPAWEAMARPILPKMIKTFGLSLKSRIEDIAGQRPLSNQALMTKSEPG